jgi:PAS domain S-box-containing protein
MKRKNYKIILGLALFFLMLYSSSIARAQDANLLILSDQGTRYPLGLHLEYLEDPGGTLTIEQVTQPAVSARFTPNLAEIPNLGITNSAYWFRFPVRNQTGQESWMLAFSNARVGLIDLYVSNADGSGWVNQQAGTYLPAAMWAYAFPHFTFPLSLKSSAETIVYLRLESNLPMRLALSLWSSDAFEQHKQVFYSFVGLFYGGVATMALYNLLLFFSIRKAIYLYYFLFSFFGILNVAVSDGVAPLFLYPNMAFKYAIYSTSALIVIFIVLYMQEFLELKFRLPWMNRIIIALGSVQAISLIGYFFYPPVFALGSVIVLVNTLLAILASILVWRQGLTAARYFLLAWLGIFVNTILLNFANLRLIAGFPLDDLGKYISTTLLVVLLSMSLVDQINVLRTKALEADVARHASEKRFRHLYERAPLGIAIADADGKLEQANRAFQELLGYEETELQNISYQELVYPDDRDIAEHNFGKLSQDKDFAYEGEIRYQQKNGKPVWVARSVSTLRGEDGEIQHTFGMFSDISNRKKQEAELRRYSENLEELVAARTRELERSREQLIILNRSSQVVNAAGLDTEQVYIAIRAAAAWLVPAEVFVLCLVNQAAGQCDEVFLADGDQRLPGSSYPLEGSFFENMLAEGNSLKVDDFQDEDQKRWQFGWFGNTKDVRSGIAVLLRGKKEMFGVLSVQSYQPQAYLDTDQSILESFAAHVAITLENIQLYQQAEKSAVLEERQRLARELHDSVTQLLYSMALMSGGWVTKAHQGALPNPSERFGQIEALSLQALKEMRLLIHQLSPSILGEVGLLQAIQNRLDAVEKRVNVDAQLRVEGSFPAISPIVEEEIYFIILEALNNALRHAHASTTLVVIQADAEKLHITVEDNGRGYDPAQPSSGMGSTTMRDRAKMIGAQLNTQSQPGQGTRVSLTIELESDGRENIDE